MTRKKSKPRERRRELDDRLDRALRDTFPASDPVALTQPSRKDGAGDRKDKATPRRRSVAERGRS